MNKPNLIFIFSDQQHWRALGCADPSFRTPNLDRFVGDAVRFETTYCTTPLCSPSRATIMTGQLPHRHGVVNNGMPLQCETIAPRLQEAGYHTAYFGKWHLNDRPIATKGWDEQQGVCNEFVAPNRPLSDSETSEYALDFLSRVDDTEKPFALFVSLDEPHAIYWSQPNGGEYPVTHCREPEVHDGIQLPSSWYEDRRDTPIPYDSMLPGKQQPFWESLTTEAQYRRYRAIYRDRVREYDSGFGKLMDAIVERGLLERSVVVQTSDHGDMDAHHRMVFKGPAPYEQLQRIPLAIRVPHAFGGGNPALDTQSLVSNADLFPTLLDFAGVSIPPCDGLSLKPRLLNQTHVHSRTDAIIEFPEPGLRTLRHGPHKYSIFPDGGEMLFDLEADPEEMHNLTNSPEHQSIRKQLADRLTRIRIQTGDIGEQTEPLRTSSSGSEQPQPGPALRT